MAGGAVIPEKDNFLKQLWDLIVERRRTRKALRLLAKQEWSVEFLEALLVRASRTAGKPLQMEVVSPQGVRLVVTTLEEKRGGTLKSENIFDRLDDAVAVNQFIAQVQRGVR
jgi:hypothetical protein